MTKAEAAAYRRGYEAALRRVRRRVRAEPDLRDWRDYMFARRWPKGGKRGKGQ